MKKIILLLSLIVLLTGCSIEKVNDKSIDGIIDTVLTKEIKLSNSYFEGYKYYLPRGMQIIDKKQYNAKIIGWGNTYYLYVDAIAYKNNIVVELPSDEDTFYFKELSYKDKTGYISITEKSDKYFLEIMYNYAKIEVLVSEKDLNKAIINSCYILSSVKFNDKVLETLIGENTLNYKETLFDRFGPHKDSGDFLQYEKDYGTYYEEETPEDKRDSETLKTEKND